MPEPIYVCWFKKIKKNKKNLYMYIFDFSDVAKKISAKKILH
jgi:hypothetical protein